MKGICVASAAAAISAIAGCSGGGAGCGAYTNCYTAPPSYPVPQLSSVALTQRQTVQAGTTATFTATPYASGQPQLMYEWCRVAPTGGSCAKLNGEVGPVLTIANVGIADDGARYFVTARTSDGQSRSASSELLVSSMPGVVFQDGEFADSDWVVGSNILPAGLASAGFATRASDGGHPGAYRRVIYDVAHMGEVHVSHVKTSAVYDPASQGALRAVDFSIDCFLVTGPSAPFTVVLLEQAGRKYTSGLIGSCTGIERPIAWHTDARASLLRADFTRVVDGPPCGSGEDCPDFSAAGAPIRFGMATEVFAGGSGAAGDPPLHFEHGLDNWKVTAWRK